MKFKTYNPGEDSVEWTIEINWKTRKKIIEDGGVSLDNMGGISMDSDTILDALLSSSCIRKMGDKDKVSKDILYNIPLIHVQQLIQNIASWVLSGKMVDMQDAMRKDGTPEEDMEDFFGEDYMAPTEDDEDVDEVDTDPLS